MFELTGTSGEMSVAAASALSPDTVITIEPNVFFGLATRQISPQAARKRAAVEGDSGVASQVLDALSGAASSV